MRTATANFEEFKLRIDQIADARGITFSEKMAFIENAMNHLKSGQILQVFCSDLKHKKQIPDWLKQQGYLCLGIINQSNFFKIILIKS